MKLIARYQTFAIHSEGHIVHIDQVPRGLECNCACGDCGARLVAKKGSVKVHHFAHESKSDCSGGIMTVLHRAAQDVIMRENVFVIPGYSEKIRYRSEATGLLYYSDEIKIDSREIPVESVDDEVPMLEESGTGKPVKIIPDIVLRSMGRELIVEIYVTHSATANKIEWLRRNRQPAVEIDLSGYLRKGWSWEELRQEVVFSTNNKKWLFNSKIDEANRKATEAVVKEAEAADEVVLAGYAERRSKIHGADHEYLLLKSLDEQSDSEAWESNLDAQGRSHPDWLTLAKKTKSTWDTPPVYLGIKLRINSGFRVHPKVWQANVINTFLKKPQSVFSRTALANIMVRKYGYRHEFNILEKYKSQALPPKDRENLPSPAAEVSLYFDELERMRIIKNIGGDHYTGTKIMFDIAYSPL